MHTVKPYKPDCRGKISGKKVPGSNEGIVGTINHLCEGGEIPKYCKGAEVFKGPSTLGLLGWSSNRYVGLQKSGAASILGAVTFLASVA